MLNLLLVIVCVQGLLKPGLISEQYIFQVYTELQYAPQEREFNSILTMREAAELCMAKNPQTLYFRIPLSEDKAPEEKVR